MTQIDWGYASRELQREWESTSLGHSRPWEEVESDARYGWDQAMSSEFAGAEWQDVEDLIRSRWEESFPHQAYEDWRDISEAVRFGFLRAREMVS